MESYEEEYYGLVALNTFTVIDAEQYQEIRTQTGKQAIPSMGILTVKNDAEGRPVRAKSRIVVLGNHETTPWSKTELFCTGCISASCSTHDCFGSTKQVHPQARRL
jgi:hypothetical protein